MRPCNGRDVEPPLDGLAVTQVLQAQPVSAGLCVAFGETDIDERAHEIEGSRLGKPGHHSEIAQRHPVARSHRVEECFGAPDGLNACFDRKCFDGSNTVIARSRAPRATLHRQDRHTTKRQRCVPPMLRFGRQTRSPECAE